MSVTVFTAFQPKLKGVCPRGSIQLPLIFLLRAKSQYIVIYSVFVPLAWKKYILQHAENCINTSVFARHSKKHCKYRDFCDQKQKTSQIPWFWSSGAQKTIGTRKMPRLR